MAKGVSLARIHEDGVKRWKHARDYYRPWNDLFGRLLAFTQDHEHYKRNYSWGENNPARIQPKTMRLFNVVRHKLVSLATQEIRFEVKPVQFDADAYGAQLSQKILEQTILDPALRYRGTRSQFLNSTFSGGRGVIAWEYNPNVPGGVVARLGDPRRTHAAPGVLDFHQSTCPFWVEEVPMHVYDVRKKADEAGWRLPKNIHPDNWKSDYSTGNRSDTSNQPFDGQSNDVIPGVDEGDVDGIMTILVIHWRWDPFAETTNDRYDLPREDWHWQDPQQTDFRVPLGEGQDATSAIAPLGPSGQPMRLNTTRSTDDEFYRYPAGRKDIIWPFNPEKKALWTGDWLPGKVNANVRLAHVPYMFMCAYRHPLRLIGTSDPQLLKTLVQIDDMSLRQTWEQLRMAQALVISQRGALTDANGRPFVPSDKPIEWAFTDSRLQAEGVKSFQMAGMNPAMGMFRQFLASEWQWIGTGDVAMPDDRSRDVPVGTMQAMQAMGDLPLKSHQQDLAEEEAIGFRTALDLKRAYMTAPEMVGWVSETGDPMAEMVTSDMLAPVHVTVQTEPDMTRMQTDKIQAIAQFFGQIEDPQLRAELAPSMGFPPHVVQRLKAMAQNSGPSVPPDKLMNGLAALYKAGVPVTLNDVNAVLQQAGLPPLQPPVLPSGAASAANSNKPGPPNGGPRSGA